MRIENSVTEKINYNASTVSSITHSFMPILSPNWDPKPYKQLKTINRVYKIRVIGRTGGDGF